MTRNPETIFRQIVENPRAPQHARISALRFLSNPSFALLARLVNDSGTPGRLACLAASTYAAKFAAAQLEKEKHAAKATIRRSD